MGGGGRFSLVTGGLKLGKESATACADVWVRWAGAVGEVELRDASPLLQQVIMRMELQGKLRLQR